MANSLVYRHYVRALRLWPKDLLRPEASFQDAMRRRLERRSKSVKDDAQGNLASISSLERNEQAELKQVNALYSLLENRYQRMHPVSDAFFQPASNPTYYSNLLAELDAAPQRSWLASRLNKWRGFLRFR